MNLEIYRSRRNRILAESDWTQMSDSPLSEDKKNEWKEYRKKLRNMFDNVITINSNHLSAQYINPFGYENPFFPPPPNSTLSSFNIYSGTQPVSSLSAQVSTDFTFFNNIPDNTFYVIDKDGVEGIHPTKITNTSLTLNLSAAGIYNINFIKSGYDRYTGFFKLSVI